MQAAVETVVVDDDVARYCVDLVVATRHHSQVQIGASPRGALALLLCARAHAVISGRDYVTPEDVKAVAPSVLPHRITIKPELWLTRASGTTVTDEVLASVPTPTPGGTISS
jgi:MoxR-like ATPase